MIRLLFLLLTLLGCGSNMGGVYLLNVSYDPTREMYAELNSLFEKELLKEGRHVQIFQSHGGSSKQANLVTWGLRADVVTLGMESDIQKIANKGFISQNWQEKFPNLSTPYYSTVVLMVRKGNPKNIHSWEDLTRNVQVITPNPKTSSGGKWNFLAAYGYFKIKGYSNPKKEVRKIYKNVVTLDSGARASASTFLQRKIGDVLIIWENEALLALREKVEPVEIVYPLFSIYAQPMVAIVERTTKMRNTQELAEEYLKFLYSESSQEVIAKHGFRPIHEEVFRKFSDKYPNLNLFKVNEVFGTWQEIEKEIFANGKLIDEVLE
ncbi:MAG: sulfate ABC transporter substrate-binding protein [Leptospiraceae bacterium]|nr:sulfate ABC transporter substrate-binding protein [Leptospiraceae bacterium]